jgi:hypothetical protein
VAGDDGVAKWIANKLKDEGALSVVESIGSGFLEIACKDGTRFTAAAIGIQDVIGRDHVVPLFELEKIQPQFVVNVPSKAIWSGSAIDFIHDAPAAFGTFGELIRASREVPVSAYRNKNYIFFERAFRQHTAVREVTRLYDRVFQLGRGRGLPDVTVVLVDAYDMSAEDIRNARDRYGKFQAALKTSSYGSITTAANDAAASMGAEAFKFGELLGRLNKP